MKSIGIFLFIAVCISVGVLSYGEVPFPVAWKGLLQRISGKSGEWNPLLDERLPRLIVLLCSGASLAVSGAVMQSLFQNPLAAPNVLGISIGGTLASIGVLVFGWHLTYPFAIPIAAVGGSLAVLILVYTISLRRDHFPTGNLILTGIAFSTVLLALQSSLLYALRDHWQLIQTITEWQSGSTFDRTWNHVHMQLPLTIVGLFICLYYREEMNILALGDAEASNLGVEVRKVRWRLFLSIALLTGGALASIGVVAFFGLILPHIIRSLSSPDNRTLLPFSAVTGGLTLASMDLTLRICHVHLFTIGNISAVFGGIFFLILLTKPQQLHLLEE